MYDKDLYAASNALKRQLEEEEAKIQVAMSRISTAQKAATALSEYDWISLGQPIEDKFAEIVEATRRGFAQLLVIVKEEFSISSESLDEQFQRIREDYLQEFHLDLTGEEQVEDIEVISETPIGELGLEPATWRVLTNNGLHTVESLMAKRESLLQAGSSLDALTGIGSTREREIGAALERYTVNQQVSHLPDGREITPILVREIQKSRR